MLQEPLRGFRNRYLRRLVLRIRSPCSSPGAFAAAPRRLPRCRCTTFSSAATSLIVRRAKWRPLFAGDRRPLFCRQSILFLRLARWPESLFRAAADVDGVPVADAIQCWLDVSGEPARGAEQAGLIWRRVLGPALANGEPEP